MHTYQSLKAQLAQMGIDPRGTLLVHSSMKAIGEVEGRADTVLDALCDYIKDGLLIFPTHTWDAITRERNVMEVATEPCCVGILPELFRKRPGVVRSFHPTHSVAALGREAEADVAGEENAHTPCWRGGCWGKLYDRQAQILFVGCPLKRNTFLHGVEEWCDIPGRLWEEAEDYYVLAPDGTRYYTPQNRHNNSFPSEHYDKMEPLFAREGAVSYGFLGDAKCILGKAREMADITAGCLKRNPRLFDDDAPLTSEDFEEKPQKGVFIMDKKLKIAVIGCGNISGSHLQAYAKNPAVEIYALCDINEKNLKRRAEEYGVTRLYADKDQMLRELPEIDAVSVCTWNAAHAECAIAALNAGKHVLCEKPMAMNAAQAQEMLETARRNNRLLMIGFVRRFGNDCAILKDFIDHGQMGELYYAKATYLRRKGCPGGWFGDKSRSGGGPLIDLGVHVIDLTRYLMGNPKPVSIYGATFHKLGDRAEVKGATGYQSASRTEGVKDIFDVEDMATAMVRYDNGAVLQVEASFSLNIEKDTGTIELFGTKAGAKLDPELTLYNEINGYMANVKLDAPTALSFNGLFDNEVNHFVDCVRTGAPCRNPAEDGVELMRILDGIYESARTGHEVVLG